MATMMNPDLDSEWLAQIDAKPHDNSLRASYFAALDAAGDPRGELARLEAKIVDLDLAAPERGSLKKRRNDLREAIDPAWRDRFGFGTQPGCDKPLPWPDDTATRWLSLYEYIEECRGVWLPESAKPPFATHGSSVTAWRMLLHVIEDSELDYGALLRDAMSFYAVPEWPRLYSILVAGENDFHWAVADDRRNEEDPPIHGMNLDYNTNKFVPTQITGSGPCTCFARVTDFVRTMFEVYDDFIREDRFLLRNSKAPAKPYTEWSISIGRKPTSTDLNTAQYREDEDETDGESTLDEVLDAMEMYWEFDRDTIDFDATFGALSMDEETWEGICAALSVEWDIDDFGENIDYTKLTINSLATMKSLAAGVDSEEEDAHEDEELQNQLPEIEIEDATGRIRTDLDLTKLLAGIKKTTPSLVGKSFSQLVLRWRGAPGKATLTLRLSNDGRYMATHIGADGFARTAIVDDEPKKKAMIAIAGEPKTLPGDHFMFPYIAAALVERFVLDGGQDPCVEWRRSSAHL